MPRFRTRIPVPQCLPDAAQPGVILPRFVHEYLHGGAGEGSRNERLHRCAQQFFAAGLPMNTCMQQVLPRAMADGLGQYEACQTIVSAYRSTVVTQPLKSGSDSRTYGGHGSVLSTGSVHSGTYSSGSPHFIDQISHAVARSIAREGVAGLAQAATEVIQKSACELSSETIFIDEEDGAGGISIPLSFTTGGTLQLHGEEAMKAALNAAFREGEHIAICPSQQREDHWSPGYAIIHAREAWMKRLPQALTPSEGGCYLSINPLRPGAQRRLREEIVCYRHVLVEWEGLTLDEQVRRLYHSRLPLSVVTLSGGRSVHGWVRVDAPDLPTWERRRDMIFATLNCDAKNSDVSRISRLPGFMRGGKEQRLLALHAGMQDWTSWEQWVRSYADDKLRAQALGVEITQSAAAEEVTAATDPAASDNSTADAKLPVISSPDPQGTPAVTADDGLPPIISLDELFRADPKPPPEVVKGVLYQGTKMMIGAPSKARKSWVLLDLGLSVVSGTPWLGFPTTQGKVLMLNFELKPFMLNERLQKLARGRNYSNFSQAVKDFHLWNLRGRIHDLSMLAPKLIQRIRESGYSLVILDPIYKGLGDRDENHAGDINQLLTELEQVAQSSGAAVLYTHHFAKGNAGDRMAIDRTSGSGVWARDPDTIMMLTPPPPQKKADERGGGHDKSKSRSSSNSSSYRDKSRVQDDTETARWDYEVEVIARAHPRVEPFHISWQGAHYEREGQRGDGSTRQVIMKPRDGGMACEYGEILAGMPRLRRDRDNNEQCPVLNWIRSQTGLGIQASLRVFDTLRQPRYPYLKSEGEAWWRGGGSDLTDVGDGR